MNLIIVGIGGIGSHLLLPLLQYLSVKNRFDDVVLVDGDKYESKNTARQVVPEVGKNKALATTLYYQEMFPNLNVIPNLTYINKSNVSQCINDDDVVLVCVDNNETRALIEEYAITLDNITIISGGNELFDGNVIIMQRKNGKPTTSTISEIHPEIKKSEDHPEALSCEALAQSEPQISITNASIADVMRRILFAMMFDGVKYNEVYINLKNGNIRNVKIENTLIL